MVHENERGSFLAKFSNGGVLAWLIFAFLFWIGALALSFLVVCFLCIAAFGSASEITGPRPDNLGSAIYELVVILWVLSAASVPTVIVASKTNRSSTKNNCKIVLVAITIGICITVVWLVVFTVFVLISPSGLAVIAVLFFSVPSFLLLHSAIRQNETSDIKKGLVNSTMLSMAVISIMLAIFVPIAQELGSPDQAVCSCDQCAIQGSAMRNN